LLPGNHDPLQTNSVYQEQHPFRQALPKWVHVVDRDGFEFSLNDDAVLYATPCRSVAGQEDPTLKLPLRAPGDQRVRIGMVHGNTFDMEGHQNNFPIAPDAAHRQGLDYLAIGDHHSSRRIEGVGGGVMVYPGTHEPLSFGESESGNVAVVSITKHRKSYA